MRALAAFLIALSVAAPAAAADLTVSVRTSAGLPVRDAVVTVRYPAGVATAPIKFAWPLTVTQQNIQFDPFVLIVPVGSDVTFPNKDKVRHHVYSFSAAKRFELKLYGQEAQRTVKFDKAGVVALGCNIHDQMIGFLIVVDTPYAAKSDDSGNVVLTGLPAGPATLTVWHPYLKGSNNQMSRPLTLARQGETRETVAADIRIPAGAPTHAH